MSQVNCSICMAIYNGEKHLKRQLDSILSQLKYNDELVISDDNSTDKSIELIKGYQDPRINLIRNTKTSGLIHNFENALNNAKGEFIFLADQDDFWLPNKLTRHLELMKHYDLVLSDAIVVNEKGEIIYSSYFAERKAKKGLLNNLLRNSYIGCCMSFNKKILHLALPFPKSIYIHDWWIGLVAERFGKVYFDNTPTINYIRHGENASPTLEKSNYSLLKRFNNRFRLFTSLLMLRFK